MTKNKKFALSVLTALISLSSLYTASWFISKNYIENTVHNYFAKLMNDTETFEEISYDLEVNCFPYLCVEVKDVKIDAITGKNSKMPKAQITAFSKYPFTYKTKNIFYPQIKILKPNLKADFKIIDKSNNIPILFELFANDLNIKGNKNKAEISISKATMMASFKDSPLMTILDTGYFQMTSEDIPAKKLNETNITLSDFKKFDNQGNVISSVDHLNLDATFENYERNQLAALITNFRLSKTYETKADSLEALIKHVIANNTSFNIKDFKLTSNRHQISAKGKISINKEYFLVGDSDISVHFLKPSSMPEQMLQALNTPKTENGSYNIKLQQTAEGFFLNNKKSGGSINLKRVIKTAKTKQPINVKENAKTN